MDFLQDVRLSLRIFRRNPVFTLAAVFVLALSIGANASIFTVVDSILIRPLEYRHPERLVTIWSISPDHRRHPFTIPGFLDYRERSRVFDSIAALGSWNANLSGEGNPQRVTGVRASANYFEMLGVVPAAGRVFVPDDDAPGRPKVALLAYPLFQQRYGGDFEVVGRNILLNGEPYTVVGVLPPHFRFPGSLAEIAVPLSPDTDPWRNNRNSVHFLRLFGRLTRHLHRAGTPRDLGNHGVQPQREPVRLGGSHKCSNQTLISIGETEAAVSLDFPVAAMPSRERMGANAACTACVKALDIRSRFDPRLPRQVATSVFKKLLE